MASEDLTQVFENERTAGWRETVTVSRLEIPLHAEVNIGYGLVWRLCVTEVRSRITPEVRHNAHKLLVRDG